MIAETKSSPAAKLTQSLETVDVPVTVQVIAANPPTDPPTFNFQGFDTRNSIWIDSEVANFALALSPQGFPDGWSVTYNAFFPPIGPGPITWLSPGKEQPVQQPDYISDVTLSNDSMLLTFTDTNNATPDKDDLISFEVNIVVTQPDGFIMLFDSYRAPLVNPHSEPYTSPDPTIINVDPT